MSFRLAPEDARRGGLIILGAGMDVGRSTARDYAASGYEVIVAESGDDPASLTAGLAPPIFVIAFPDAAVDTWSIADVAAASIVADRRIAPFTDRAPAVPTIVHLDRSAHDQLAGAFESAQPDLPVHLNLATIDGERLLRLRALRLFSSKAGGRGEA